MINRNKIIEFQLPVILSDTANCFLTPFNYYATQINPLLNSMTLTKNDSVDGHSTKGRLTCTGDKISSV